MRDLILQLLPIVGVVRVPGVLQDKNARKPYVFKEPQVGTPFKTEGVPRVSNIEEHKEHLLKSDVFIEKFNEIKAETRGTFGTPDNE